MATTIFRFMDSTGSAHVGVELPDGARFDMTSALPEFNNLAALLRFADAPEILHNLLRDENEALQRYPIADNVPLLPPCDSQEIWASGVTYLRSKVARMEESKDAGGGDFYDRVYDADRPELFFKSVAERVVTTGQPIRVRKDSTWNVPEPELTLVLSRKGQIVGVTVGNDMSSRSIEGENPLYLPQAKTYDGSCALGPMIRVLDDELDIHNLPIRLEIVRNGETAFVGETNTNQMRRKPHELADWLLRELFFADGVFLMTGTGIIPQDDFSLQHGDFVRITIQGVGVLENPVA